MATKQIINNDVQTEGSALKRRSRRNNNTMNYEIYESVPPSTLNTSFVQVDVSQPLPKQGKSKQEMKVDKDMSNLKSDNEDDNDNDVPIPTNSKKVKKSSTNTFRDIVLEKVDEIRSEVASKLKKINKDFVIDNTHNTNPNVSKSDDIKVNFKLFYNTYKFKDSQIITRFTKAKSHESKSKKIEMLRDEIPLDDLIDFFLMVQDINMKGQYHEYIPFHKMIFNYEELIDIYFKTNKEDINKEKIDMYHSLINYYGFCDDQYADHFKVRYETQVINLIQNRFKYDEFLGKFYDQIKIVFQHTIDNETKFNDICIMDDIIIEIQENDGNHYNNPNDNYKKEIAIRDNKIIIYYYQKKDNRNKQNYFNTFYLQLKKLVAANLFKKYPESCMHYRTIDFYDINREELHKRREELKIATRNNVNDQLSKLQLRIDKLKDILINSSRETLNKFFNWRDESYRCKVNKQDDRCIDLYELLEETKIDELNYDKIVDKYNDDILEITQDNGQTKYMINWLTINFIVIDPLNDDENTKRNLMRYHVYADESYKKIIDIITYKSDLFNKLNAEKNETDTSLFKKKSDIKLARKDRTINEKTAQAKRYLTIIKNSHKNDIKMKIILDEFELDLSTPQSKIVSVWNKKIVETEELIKSTELINENVSNNTNNKPRQFIINKLKLNEPPLIITGFKTKFPIYYTGNHIKDFITKEDLIGVLNDFKKIPKKIQDQIIRLFTGTHDNSYDDMPNIFTGYKLDSLYNNEEQDIIVELEPEVVPEPEQDEIDNDGLCSNDDSDNDE